MVRIFKFLNFWRILKIRNKINQISISTKILFGFILVFALFLLMAVNFYQGSKNDLNNIKQISLLSQNSARILNINREISEIQRLAILYGQTGSESILDKINNTYKTLRSDLDSVSQSTTSKTKTDLIESLKKVMAKILNHFKRGMIIEKIFYQKNYL